MLRVECVFVFGCLFLVVVVVVVVCVCVCVCVWCVGVGVWTCSRICCIPFSLSAPPGYTDSYCLCFSPTHPVTLIVIVCVSALPTRLH